MNPIPIDNQLKTGVKMSEILPELKIIAIQQKLNLTKLSHFKKAMRILLISINHN